MINNRIELKSFRCSGLTNTFVSSINEPQKSISLGDEKKAVLRQELMVLLMNLGVLVGGISLALPSVTLDQLTDPNEDVHLDKTQASWYASCSSLSCPLGSLLCAYMADKFGRKITLIISNILGIISWILMAFPLSGNSDTIFLQLMASRLITGIVKGLGGTTAAVYGAEVGSPKIRARLIMGTTMAMASGVLFIFVLGYFIRNNWHLLGVVLLGYQIFCLFCLISVKESPSWLMLKGRLEESKRSLSYFRGLNSDETHEEVDSEFVLLANKFQCRNGERKASIWKSLRLPEVYKPFAIAIVFYILQQFAGTFVVIVFAVQILANSGINIDPFLCAVYLGIARFFVATFVMTWQLEKWTRRQVGIFSAISMAFCMFVLAGTRWFTWLQIPYLPAGIMISFVITCAGLWALPFVICSEIFPQNVRGACCGVTDGFAYLMSFWAIKVFPSMEDEMGSANVFAFYGITAIITAVFIYVYVPETKGKTLLEIEEYFRSKKEAAREDIEAKEVFFDNKIL